MTAIYTYFKDSIEELHQVRWPTRKQAVRLSLVVLAFTIVSSAIFGLIDVGLAMGVRFLLSSL